MIEGFSIRKATQDDLGAIVDIETKNSAKFKTKAWPLKIFQDELAQEKSRFFVFTDDETDEVVVGYVMARIHPDYAEILNVSVSPDFQRRGYGALLVRTIVNDAMRQELKKVFLEVRKSNEAAIQLYHSLNFEIIRVRKNYYNLGDGRYEDAYEMDLSLADVPS